jgi:ABC-type nitrate/sulfonate/bicarbonate transport system permease component
LDVPVAGIGVSFVIACLVLEANPLPALAWTPIAVIRFGLGNQTVIIITAFATVLPIAMAVWTGVKDEVGEGAILP